MTATRLLCELHAHTRWSDGELTVRQLVDLYGNAGFDVLAVTDHVVRPDGGEATHVHAGNHAAYLAEIEEEAERALALHGLLVLPGVELTYDDPDPSRAAHVVCVGLRDLVPLDGDLDPAVRSARELGAALIAAHPYPVSAGGSAHRPTTRFASEPDWARSVVDRFELVNRHETFDWVAAQRLPAVANGDFHRPEHLTTWKTVLHAEKSQEAVVELLRSGRAVDMTRVDVQIAA